MVEWHPFYWDTVHNAIMVLCLLLLHVDCGRTTTSDSCTCCSSTSVAENYSHTYETPVVSQPARRCSTPPRSSWRSNISTHSVSSTAISNPRTCCSTGKDISNSPTSASLRNSRTGASSYWCSTANNNKRKNNCNMVCYYSSVIIIVTALA